ncbi:hypothetical protein VMCG_06130 [Cytospora schulzeri]|uniref:Clr5 domain-containing protein n=1 Tax=Cytospora schulzeri TaxID=448051 RepID=A0A423WGP7_9PEZI|nr:hypothetical protein VMCG_06130 [Valsa malicola]
MDHTIPVYPVHNGGGGGNGHGGGGGDGGGGGRGDGDGDGSSTAHAAAATVALPPLNTTVRWSEKKQKQKQKQQHHNNPLTVLTSSSSSSSLPSLPSPPPPPPPPGNETTTTPASTTASASVPAPAPSDAAPRGGETTAAAAAGPPPAPLDWETYKDTIKDLYMGQNLNLNQVVERMRAYDFHATVNSYQIAHANDATRCVQAILSDIRGHVYSFFSRKPDWQQSPGTGLISAYNYSFYDSFRIALDSFLKNEHYNGGEILRQAFVEAEEAIQTDYSSTFYFFFIDLPDLFLHYGRHDIFVILLQHINRLTAVSLRDKIIGAGFASLHALARSNPAFLRYYISAASGLWCDLLKELRGPSDRSTLLARRNHIRHARSMSDQARVRDLCEDYDRLLGEVKNRWGAGHNASRHLEDVILLTQLNYGHFMEGFVERNERLIEDVGRKYQLASSATARSPVTPVSIESISNAGDGKFETLPLEAWDIIDRNIRSNCYHRLSCYYTHQGGVDVGGGGGVGGGADPRASLCSRKAREGWKTDFWQLEVEGALVDSGRLFEADTLRRCRLEAQYFKKLPVNDWSIAAAELDYYLNIRPSLLRTMAPTAGGAWAPSLGYGNMPGLRHIAGN